MEIILKFVEIKPVRAICNYDGGKCTNFTNWIKYLVYKIRAVSPLGLCEQSDKPLCLFRIFPHLTYTHR